MRRRRFSGGDLLVFDVFLLLIALGFYFGLLKTPEAGGWRITGWSVQ